MPAVERGHRDCHACYMAQPNDLLAFLVDADNVPPSKIGAVLAEVARLGTASVKRVYGDWTTPNLTSWKAAASEHVIQPMQQFANTKGKNATDSALIIDAMDLLYTGRFHGFCIVSSDSDFTRLASRIREEGVTVYGFGERKTPEAFRNACDRFTYLDVLDEPASESTSAETTRVTPAKLRSDTRLVHGLRTSVATASGEERWANLSAVGQLMRKQHPDFDSRNWGYAKLSDLIRATELFVVEPRPSGGLQIQDKRKISE
ncbi:NYN domain-containing protein [Homoserinimonas sp. A447]